MFLTPLIWMKVNHAQEKKNTFTVCILALWNLWIFHFNKYILERCLVYQNKGFSFCFKITEAQDKTRKVHPAMYILLQTCHFRHLSKMYLDLKSNPTEALFCQYSLTYSCNVKSITAKKPLNKNPKLNKNIPKNYLLDMKI